MTTTQHEPMTDLVVVGVCGAAGSGKDSAAKALVFHRDCFRVALGDTVKGALDDISGITREVHKQLAESGKSTGWAWQVLGGNAREDVPGAESTYVNMTLIKIVYLARYHYLRHRRFVIPDVRYPHEPEALGRIVRHLGGRYATLGLTRPGVHRVGADGRDPKHASEALVSSVRTDASYVNGGSLDDLHVAATRFFDAASAGAYDRPASAGKPPAPAFLVRPNAITVIDGEVA